MLTTDTYLPTIRKAVLMATDVMRLYKAIYQPLEQKIVFRPRDIKLLMWKLKSTLILVAVHCSINCIFTSDTSCRTGHAIGIDIKLFEGSPKHSDPKTLSNTFVEM